MSTPLSFGTNNITVYSYEPFSYRLSNNVGGTTKLTPVSRTSGIPASYIAINDSSATFSTTSNAMTPGLQQFIITLDTSLGSNISTSTTNVTSAPGRFTDGAGNSLGLSNYTFYVQEPITPIRLYAPFNLATPVTATPTLPPGLSFSTIDLSYVSIVGTPLTTVPQSNYLVIGRQTGTSKVVSSTLPIIVSNERIRTNITNGGLFSGMLIDTPVTSNVLTAIGNGTIRYTWPPFPDGIFATDNSGTTVTSGFNPSDPSKTLIIKGTPTSNAAISFINNGYSNGLTQTITAQRISPLPVITNLVDVTFQFGETVLFDTPVIPSRFFTNVTLDPSETYFRAVTYFNGSVDISSIFSPNLRSDLSLAFIKPLQRAYLTGTPLSPSLNTYTIRAINSNGVQRDLSATLTVVDDSITFQSPTPAATDVCYNFVFTRSVDLSLNGYYPAPIQYVATSAAGKPITWSSVGLAGTDLLLDTCGNRATITGTPYSIVSLRNLRVTATAAETNASANRDISFAIVNDVVTIRPTNAGIPQQIRTVVVNQPMNPTIQLRASALSGSAIRTFTATGLPPGLKIGRSGLISGTPTSNVDFTFTADISATTGFTTGSETYSIANVRDNTIVMMPKIQETVPTIFSGVEFRTLGYSGLLGITDVSTSRGPWQGANFSVSIPDGVNLQGNFITLPALLPKYRIAVRGSLSNAVEITLPVDVDVTNPSTFVRHILGVDNETDPANTSLKLLRNTGPSVELNSTYGYTFVGTALSWTTTSLSSSLLNNVPYGIHDMAQNGSVIVAVLGSNMVRTVDAGITWSQVPSSNIQSIDVSGGVPPSVYTANPLFGCIATDGVSNWLTIANGSEGSTYYNILRTSSNNGASWVDTSLNQFVDINSNTKLYYNNSRYFVLPGATATNPLLYAESSNLSSWTAPTFSSGDIFNDMAFSNNTAVVVGSNGSSSACYRSSNNGGTWTALSSSPIAYSGAAEINAVSYAYGQWSVAGRNAAGNVSMSFSTDLTTWGQSNIGLSGRLTASVEDGSAWLWAGTTGGITSVWNSNASLDLGYTGWQPSGLPSVGSKRIVATALPPIWPSALTFSMPYDPGVMTWLSPTRTSYINWQYVPIQPIEGTVNVSNIAPAAVYYYAYGIPEGFTFFVDDFARTFTITGTSPTFNDAPQNVFVFASYFGDTSNYTDIKILPLGLSMKTLIPTVQKQQSGAGAWTYLLRQYTEVNAAVSSRDNKAIASIEYRLGEFTRPEPPSVVTESSNCLC